MLVDTFGTGVVNDDHLTRAVLATFDARPGMLIKELDLRRPIFRKTAAYGHFGREDAEFTWEKTPLVDKLKSHAHAGNGSSVSSNGNGHGHGKAPARKKSDKGGKTAAIARA
jgi:S-adenosylmethionine synthetase, C-terminal domain